MTSNDKPVARPANPKLRSVRIEVGEQFAQKDGDWRRLVGGGHQRQRGTVSVLARHALEQTGRGGLHADIAIAQCRLNLRQHILHALGSFPARINSTQRPCRRLPHTAVRIHHRHH